MCKGHWLGLLVLWWFGESLARCGSLCFGLIKFGLNMILLGFMSFGLIWMTLDCWIGLLSWMTSLS